MKKKNYFLLLLFRLAEAKYVLHTTLLRWTDNGFAAAHYGLVLKNLDKDFKNAVIYLQQGIESNEPGTDDGRFYFNLGDALIRLGRKEEAAKVFQKAAERKLFLSGQQRSLYNVNHLKGRPFWTIQQTGYKEHFRSIESNWQRVRDEGLKLLNQKGYFINEAENLRDFGDWKQFELFARGQKNQANCNRAPITCQMIEMFPAARFCKRGQVKFSVIHPNTHVWPHCGPTNCRIRAHLGLKVPPKVTIRVANETRFVFIEFFYLYRTNLIRLYFDRTWEEGKFMIFDDSFEHEVWHNGTSFRLVLIVDVWHPDLSTEERANLAPI